MSAPLHGGCYCGAVRYRVTTEPMKFGECHCRECQYITGGGANYFLLVDAAGFEITQGTPKSFTRSDLDNPVTRQFCAECGTHLLTRPAAPRKDIVLKVGSLDNPTDAGKVEFAIFCAEAPPFHQLAEDAPHFDKRPS